LPEVEVSDIATLADLNKSLTAWLECIYHQHIHSETKQSPLARYTAGLDQVRPADPETLRRAFLWREKRKVNTCATISLQGNRYQVPPQLARQTIEVHYDPFDLAHMELYLEGNHLGTARVVEQKRKRHLVVERLATEPPQPPKPKSSESFLAILCEEHRDEQNRAIGPLHFSRLGAPDSTPEV